MKLRIFWNNLLTSVWLRPLLWILAIFVLAVVLLRIDTVLLETKVVLTAPWIFIDSGEGARTILGALATTLLTVAALAFSVLMLAVVQTANAYSPRVLREYLEDAGNQNVLGILLGTFLYTLLVLRRVQDTEASVFIPTVSVSVALVLSIISVLFFIYFINHVALSIQVPSIVRRIHEEAEEMLQHLFPDGVGRPWTGTGEPPLPQGEPLQLLARRSGYVATVAGDTLLQAARARGAVLRLEKTVGEYVFRGGLLVTVWPGGGELDEELAETVHGAISLRDERTTFQDLNFGLQQLTDVALRAISPAVNDPRTVVHCLNAAGALLVDLASRGPVSPYRLDESGALRLIAWGPDLKSALDTALLQLHPYLMVDPYVVRRLLDIYVELAASVGTEAGRALVAEHLARIAFLAGEHVQSPWDREALNERLAGAARNLQRPVEGFLLETGS